MAFLVSSEELCFQALEDLHATNPSLHVTLEKAEHHGEVDADIVVASVDTLAMSEQRLAAFASLPLRVIFIDECHGAVAPKWMKVLRALRVLKEEHNCDNSRLLIGLTATPKRHDGLALSRIFDRIVFRRSMREMTDAGWTVDLIAYRVETDVKLDDIRMREGDFATGELSNRVNTPRLNALVVQKYLEYGAGLPAIAFTVDIQHSEDLSDVFQHHGLAFEAISSNTPKRLRRELVEAHRNMELLGLVSCQALMTGFNSPPATVALWDRPCCSGLFYQQGIGRIGRPYPAPENAATHTGYRKQRGIIVDFTGTSTKHRLYTAATLYGLNPQFDFSGKSVSKTLARIEQIQDKNPTLDIGAAYAGLADIEASVSRVELWKPAPIPKLAKTCSQFTWTEDGADCYRLTAPGLSVFLEVNLLGEYEVWRRDEEGVLSERLTFSEPEDAFSYADSLIPDEVVKLIRAKAPWRKAEPTEPQCSWLWVRDPAIHNKFASPMAFFHFACHQVEAKGNSAFSRGSLSLRIDLCKRAREKAAVAR
jgi:ATP-dependent helicase IRC3